ncbi:serine-rich protein [Colletotrichum truncatum]|uniref:Serine-rich protein n=1 Tax=Colletotrichum truncatum TaxID=5467 RepID=A0ACC3YIB5_COLTU|nr:serine-rich protein [Colletotrichum truncatum]KAF6794540.1 serine-rich protein [Colletotrichum truncatum]
MSGSGSPSRGSPSRSQRRPLHERSKSQSNSLAIRVVPYSPPRPSHKNRDSTASASSSRTPTSTTALLSPNPSELGQTISSRADDRSGSASRASDNYSHRRSYSSSTLTSILSPASSTFPLVSAKDRGVSGSKLRSDTWAAGQSSPSLPVPTTPPCPTDNSRFNARSWSSQNPHDEDEPVTPTAKRPLSRRRNLVTINADGKTFSLLPQGQRNRESGGQQAHRAPTLSLSTTASRERLSSDAFSENRPSSTVTSLPDRSFSAATLTPASSTTQLAGDHITGTAVSNSSPWNYRMVGGLRKVPNTPDLKQKQKSSLLYPEPDPITSHSSSPSDSRLAPLPEASAAEPSSFSGTHDLQSKTSFQSSVTASTSSEKTNYKIYSSSSPPRADTESVLPPPSISSETTNYKVFGSSSPPAIPERDSSLPPPSSSHSNYEILGRSSPPDTSSAERTPPKTADSNQNYVVHGEPSPAPSSISATRRERLRPEYSQESLLVAPLKPQKRKKRSRERFGYYKSRSRDSLRRAASVKSIASSLSFEAAQNIIAAPAAFYRSRTLAGSAGKQPEAKAEPTTSAPPASHMKTHPHQWSSQLSTVMSESEGGSDPPSRSVSPWSAPGRRSSGPISSHSRQMLSISSSLAANEEGSLSHSRSFTDSLERPQAVHSRGGTLRLVSDQDEHGDGLTELHHLHQRPSRTRLSGFFSNTSSERNLHSSSSSRANSFNSSSIPAWAKFYYGSGERRFLASSSDSMMSDPNESRPPSSFQSRSPSAEHLPLSIYSPRRRPREVNPLAPGPVSDVGSMEISHAPPQDNFRGGLRKKTSSIWSPHLRRDQRAGRYSMWEPPSMTWSAENTLLGKRNVQVVLFALGFIFPFAWMIAAFLPLPPDPHAEMEERDHRSSLLDEERDLPRRVAAIDETLFQSARWWRALNRYMSVIGLLVVGAIAALVIVGVKQGWGQIA